MLLIGSKNPKKLHEVREILGPLGVRAVIAVNLPEVDEDGDTFAANARKKAVVFASFLRAPCLADDSGLVVPALGGEPGVHSARYAGEDGEQGADAANLQKVLRRIREEGLEEPEAYFFCHIAVAVGDEVVVEAEGRVDGRIIAEPRGENGFGYDPVFFHPPSGCTTAELEPEAKNAISHRGAALRALAEKLADPEMRARIEPA